ncbi:hypothetical protein BJX68DRAFT_270860 [Aspergillus pseudodeflectus]|uniref:Uncharacterized protein n=1 Tax=Aspergillus pseudodeflectus TaxID=176178 RepID=A0ABR4JQM8_9EURO
MANISLLLPLIILILAIAADRYWHIPSRDREPRHSAKSMQENEDQQQQGPSESPTRPPYNEDEIVQLIKDIYRTYLKLNYIKRWELVWPPRDTGHAINEALCKELGLDPAVISLMKRIPYFCDYSTAKDIEFYPDSRAMVYLEDDEIRGGRDPSLFEFQEPRLDHLLPHDIALICEGDEGSNVILDVKNNVIRVEGFHDWPPGPGAPADYDYQPEQPDEEDHYRNYYGHNAPTWLASWLQKIRSLDVIPVNYGGCRGLFTENKSKGAIVKDILQKKYGYPDNFHEDQWRRVGSKICWEIGKSILDYNDVPDDYDVDYEKEEADAIANYGKPVYAEEIDGPEQ